MKELKGNPIQDLSIQFATELMALVKELRSLNEYEIASQILRSGTSIGANVFESQNSESRRDFYHKIKLAAKEAGETGFWLSLVRNSIDVSIELEKLEDLLNQIQKILSQILFTTRRKMQ